VPTAKTVYILAHEHKVEEPLVAATVSITTMLSVVTLLAWLYVLSQFAVQTPGTGRSDIMSERAASGPGAR
jgi:malonate transporter and related proteins